MRALATSVVLGAATLGLLGFQQGLIRPSAPHRTSALITPAKLQVGVTTGPLARNWWQPWRPGDLGSVDSFEQDAGTRASIVMWYADWKHNRLPSLAQLNQVARRGSVPEITWEPWDASRGLYKSQPRYRLSSIIAGRYDSYIRGWARALAGWKHPVLLRFAQEMDGNWFPWSDYGNGNRPGQFVLAWRLVHRIFNAAGARNVKWVWSPAFGSAETWPGRGSVDVMALTCQNGGRRLFARGWESFARDCGRTIARLHRLAPSLPIQLAETSSAEAGGSKSQWISGMFAYLAHHPFVRSLIWFNVRKEADWRIESSRSAERAFAEGVRSLPLGLAIVGDKAHIHPTITQIAAGSPPR
jgi:hypothetical protein